MDDETLLAIITKIDPMTARIPPGIRQVVDAVIAAEREACAKVCEQLLYEKGTAVDLYDGAEAIRMRSNAGVTSAPHNERNKSDEH